MLTLHHLNHSRSFRILWLLEELKLAYGLEYQLVCHQRDKRTFLAPRALKDIHPMGKAPILVDTNLPKEHQTLVESALIIEYLLKKYDHQHLFAPQEELSWLDYTFWLHFAEGSLMPPVVMNVILTKTIAKAPMPFRLLAKKIKAGIDEAIINKNILSSLALIETRLNHHDWLAGSFGGADIQMHFAIKALEQTHLDLEQHYHTIAWLERCQKRQAYQNVARYW